MPLLDANLKEIIIEFTKNIHSNFKYNSPKLETTQWMK